MQEVDIRVCESASRAAMFWGLTLAVLLCQDERLHIADC